MENIDKIIDGLIEDTIIHKKFLAMKNPTILMNKDDFEKYEAKLKQEGVNSPKYKGIPIEIHPCMLKGTPIIYDKIIL